MENSTNDTTSTATVPNLNEVTVAPSPLTSQDQSSLKQQISSARATKQMLEDGISALDRCTVPVDYAVKIGILYQFLQRVHSQTTSDIKRMQEQSNG